MASAEDILSARSGDYPAVLAVLDEYSLYCHYLRPVIGEDPIIGKDYSSPMRTGDKNPSFAIFYAKRIPGRELGWKDSGCKLSGDIFDLVKIFYGLNSKREALDVIAGDFGLGTAQPKVLQVVEKKEAPPSKIWVTTKPFKSHELDWWAQWPVSRKTLDRYHTAPFSQYWIAEGQKAPYYTKGLSFCYRIWDRYQLYFPYAQKANGEKRFLTDWTDLSVPGFQQLTYGYDTLCITKAYKDMQVISELHLCDVVAYRGENTPFAPVIWEYFRRKYKWIFIMVDNDGKSEKPCYDGHSMLYIDPSSGQKDPSDFSRQYGAPELKGYMKDFIMTLQQAEQKLEEQYKGKIITINYPKGSVTGRVERTAIEQLGKDKPINYIFFMAKGVGLERYVIDVSEAKELIHVHTQSRGTGDGAGIR
jgi:hypothetical protein